MGIRFYKPVTPGRRGASVSDFAEITDRKRLVVAIIRAKSLLGIVVVGISGSIVLLTSSGIRMVLKAP